MTKPVQTCSGNVPGMTTERSAHCNPQLHTRSACRLALRLNTSSYYLEKRNTSDNFQQDLFSRNLPFSPINRMTSWRNLPDRKEFHPALLSGMPDDFWS
ncbi:hypothetical protein TNCV_4746021 [Trichonephila clavipes]|nr:hypothetical protein TNCV_4746021 [Trichonephila clavipes]